jgi:hypothetical protein
MPTKSFRSKIASGKVDTINLHTNNGSTGYKITKFQIMPANFNETDEYTIKIFKVPQTETSVNALMDFSDNTLLGAAYIETISGAAEGVSPVILFDNEIINQDIFITCFAQNSLACNYYIEMEQVKLALDENTVATLKDIRNIKQRNE